MCGTMGGCHAGAPRGGIAVARPVKVLLVATHPVQYAAPLHRLYAKDPRIDLTVAYCSLEGAEATLDPDFGISFAWDIPLLNGYRWVHPPIDRHGLGSRGFLGLVNPGLWGLIRFGEFDVVVCYGYRTLSFWIAAIAAKWPAPLWSSRPTLTLGMCGKDRSGSRRSNAWLFHESSRSRDAVLAPSSATAAHLREMGLDERRVFLTPYVVDNEFFARPTDGSRPS